MTTLSPILMEDRIIVNSPKNSLNQYSTLEPINFSHKVSEEASLINEFNKINQSANVSTQDNFEDEDEKPLSVINKK